MVVLGHRDILDDSRLLPEGFTYIYIDMRHRDGSIHQLAQG